MMREKNILLKCIFCSDSFYVDSTHTYQKYCSVNCRNANFRKLNPDKVKRYKREEKQRHYARYKLIGSLYKDKIRFGGNRRRVMERDNFACLDCRKRYPYVNLIVHHIDQDKNNNVLDNLKTLCRACHARLHSTLRK